MAEIGSSISLILLALFCVPLQWKWSSGVVVSIDVALKCSRCDRMLRVLAAGSVPLGHTSGLCALPSCLGFSRHSSPEGELAVFILFIHTEETEADGVTALTAPSGLFIPPCALPLAPGRSGGERPPNLPLL